MIHVLISALYKLFVCVYLTYFLTFFFLCFLSYLFTLLLIYFLTYLSTPSRIDPFPGRRLQKVTKPGFSFLLIFVL